MMISSVSAQWTALTGTDYPNDNLGPPLPQANLTSCQTACTQNPSCIGFSFGTTTALTTCISSPCCFLKGALSSSVSIATMTSYVPEVGLEVSASSLPGYFNLLGYADSPGNDMTDFASGNLQVCSQRCSTTLGCNGFVYVGSAFLSNPNHCWLKSTIVTPLVAWQQNHGLDPSYPELRAVGVTYRTTVITGDYSTHQSLDPDYQRFTATTWGFSDPTSLTSAPFYMATGCGTDSNPDLVTGERFQSI